MVLVFLSLVCFLWLCLISSWGEFKLRTLSAVYDVLLDLLSISTVPKIYIFCSQFIPSVEVFSPSTSFSVVCVQLPMQSGKHISLQEVPLYAADYYHSPAGSTPLYYASQWEHHRKVSITRIWPLQPDESKTLRFCFSTFPATADCQGHMQSCAGTSSSVSNKMRGVRMWRVNKDGHELFSKFEAH